MNEHLADPEPCRPDPKKASVRGRCSGADACSSCAAAQGAVILVTHHVPVAAVQDVYKTQEQIEAAGGKITKPAGPLPGLGA